MQGLMLLALEPVAETTADSILWLSEDGSAQDAMEYIFKLLARKHHRSGFWKEI